MSERSCAWMSGPRDASLRVPAVKWWLAISRDVIAKDYRRMTSRARPSVTCHRTPTFVSPLQKDS
ncbi:MAG: hypothetical protein ABR613_12485 [Actinomycetota bacterium]